MAKLCLPLGFVLAVMISADADNCLGGDCKAFGASSMLQSKASKAATAENHYGEDVRPPANSSLVAKAFAPTTAAPPTADPFDGREEEPRRELLQQQQAVLENVALDDDADDAAEFKKLLVTIKADLEGAGVLDSLAKHGVKDDKLHNLGIDIVQRLKASTSTNISEVLPPADMLKMLTEDGFSSSRSDTILQHLATLGELVMAAHIGSGSLLAHFASQYGHATSLDGTLAAKNRRGPQGYTPPRRRAAPSSRGACPAFGGYRFSHQGSWTPGHIAIAP